MGVLRWRSFEERGEGGTGWVGATQAGQNDRDKGKAKRTLRVRKGSRIVIHV